MSPSRIPLPPARGLFIAGTDTGVGKTYVACRLIEAFARTGLRVAPMKPVAAGVEADGVNEDVRLLMRAANVDVALEQVNPYCFAPAVAPHIAASRAGVRIEVEAIARCYENLLARADVVVVEGAGGLLVPLDEETGIDAIPVRLQLPVVLVVGVRLGCLNHALLTHEAMARRGLALSGWVANILDPAMGALEENLAALAQRLPAPCLGRLARDAAGGGGGLDISRLLYRNTTK